MRIYHIGIVLLFFAAISSCREKHYMESLSPEDALKSFTLDSNFEIEIFAAEPFVKDPVSLTFDDEGNAFEVEMPDYPFPVQKGGGNGQIRMLIDANDNGRIDSAVIFASGLSEATSIMPWKGGLIVTAAPDIYFMKDTNGDHRADIKEKMFTGFFKGNSEAQITALHFNIDNWIYATNSGQEGKIRSSMDGKKELPIAGADFRFNISGSEFGRVAGSGQFGQTFDRWGNRFVTHNSAHVEQAVIPSQYFYRHPYMSSFSAVNTISDHNELMEQITPAPYWRAERTNRRNATYKEKKLDKIEYADKHFTGAAGGMVYDGDAFPSQYAGNYFVADVAGNLVHRDVLFPSDASPVLVARQPDNEKDHEFLASSDPWFRPTNFCVGPDGDLYVVDMYRQHIEAPFAIPEDLKKEMNFMNGAELGRIYRIKPKGTKSSAISKINMTGKASADLVAYLSHPNMRFRLQAQRIILERSDSSVIPALKKVVANNRPEAKLHAINTLKGLKALDFTLVKNALKDQHPAVRSNAIRLAEEFPESLSFLIAMLDDSSLQVSFQATLSVGNFSNPQATNALTDILIKRGNDPWFRLAVLSSETGITLSFLESLQKRGWFSDAASVGPNEYLLGFVNVISQKNNEEEMAKLKQIARRFPASLQKIVFDQLEINQQENK